MLKWLKQLKNKDTGNSIIFLLYKNQHIKNKFLSYKEKRVISVGEGKIVYLTKIIKY